MKELETLFGRRWVLKSEDRELYYRIRDSIGEIRKFATEKLGCQVIENALLVKMEKIPALPEPFMGIHVFTSKEEYALLCILLMFLEDRDAGEQFILSQLTEYIASNMPGEGVDWTLYTNRRRLVKVLRYAADQGLIRVTDGREDAFMEQEDGEVLYENTGASRYFMRSFSRDIMEYSRPQDFQESDWFAVDEDRGIARRHRVYRRLLFSVGMYRGEGADEDFEYLKYYGRRLADDLEQNFHCQLHIHRGSAFFMQEEDCRIGETFPGNTGMSDILLLCCGKIREKIESGDWELRKDDMALVQAVEFERMIRQVKEEYGAGFIKGYRIMPEGEFIREVENEMERWMMIRTDAQEQTVIICPAAGKLKGHYPEDFMARQKEKDGEEQSVFGKQGKSRRKPRTEEKQKDEQQMAGQQNRID